MKLIKCSIGHIEVFLILAWRYSCWSIVAIVSTPGRTVILGYFLLFCIRMWSVSSVARLWPTLRLQGLEHARLPCPSSIPRACSNSCPLSRWCHPTISPSVVPFSSRLLYFPASGSFPVSRLFTSGNQSIGVSASALVLPVNIRTDFL